MWLILLERVVGLDTSPGINQEWTCFQMKSMNPAELDIVEPCGAHQFLVQHSMSPFHGPFGAQPSVLDLRSIQFQLHLMLDVGHHLNPASNSHSSQGWVNNSRAIHVNWSLISNSNWFTWIWCVSYSTSFQGLHTLFIRIGQIIFSEILFTPLSDTLTLYFEM